MKPIASSSLPRSLPRKRLQEHEIMKRSPRPGFTLVELLAVVALIAVVIAFAVPAMTQIMKGTQISQGSQVVNDTLLLARQYAISRSHAIEVRFYRYGDPDTPGEKHDDPSTGKWRAIQLFDVMENGAVLPVGEMTRLPK
jgi:prepilin-type N-terminal cleavage/methylation domain-containing protein